MSEPKKLGRPRKTPKVLPLVHWKPTHNTIAHLFASGQTTAQIADRVGYKPESIRQILKSPLMKAEIARLQNNFDNIMIEADLRMKSLLHRSIDIIAENLGEPKAGIPPKADRGEMTKDAWKVIEAVMKVRSGGPGVQINQIMNVQEVLATAKSKSDSDLVKDVVNLVRSSHDDSYLKVNQG